MLVSWLPVLPYTLPDIGYPQYSVAVRQRVSPTRVELDRLLSTKEAIMSYELHQILARAQDVGW
jgi:hypothetical protein